MCKRHGESAPTTDMKRTTVLLIILSAWLPLCVMVAKGKMQGSKHSPVVGTAMELFGAAIEAHGINGVTVYQLDMANNKDMKALKAMSVPVLNFITRPDAFWVGMRGGRAVVVGSNGRGAAYGLLHLSTLDSIAPNYETIQIPSVEYRGLFMEGGSATDCRRLFAQMLRLHANTLWLPSNDNHKASRSLADSFGIVLATPRGASSLHLQEHKKGTTVDIGWTDDDFGYIRPIGQKDDDGVVYHLCPGRQDSFSGLCTLQPGLVANEMKTAYGNGGDKLWVAVVDDIEAAACQLNMFMDMAWDIGSVRTDSTSSYVQKWLTGEFGGRAAEALAPAMSQFYRLTGIRRPELTSFARQNAAYVNNVAAMTNYMDFNAEEFGNELERYINDYRSVWRQVKAAKASVDSTRRDRYRALVERPAYCSALMAEMCLQAQEARLIGRPASFHHDSEALESAARSMKAYERLRAIEGVSRVSPPQLPDTLSRAEVEHYYSAEPVDAPFTDDNTIVRNASNFASASAGVRRVDLLGHSLSAMDMYADDSLVYHFSSGVTGGVLRLAFVPTHALDGGSLQCSVSIDGRPATTVVVSNAPGSARWTCGVLRGQAVVTLPVSLAAGSHTLTVKALSDHVVLDQWMIDRDTDRRFYIFPTQSAPLGKN